MKWAIIILVLLYSCSEKHSSGQLKTVKSDSLKIEKKATNIEKDDSIINIECIHQDLSKTFDFKLVSKRIIFQNGDNDSYVIKVTIIDKKTQKSVDSILISSRLIYGEAFKNCENIRSYITGKNENKEAPDNDYGVLIVADLNFDSKDDIAIINDSGGNGGVFYSYYVQGENSKFKLDKYLTDSMVYFPSKIDKKRKMLITYVHAGVCGLGEHKYVYNSTNSWKEISHKIINICKK